MTSTDTFTRVYGLIKPRFDKITWHDDVNGNFDKLDTLIEVSANLPSFDTVWKNATAYSIGTRLYDSDDPGIWECVVAHTSAATGTFSQDRATHPSYWVFVDTGLTFRGAWTTATAYRPGDVAYDAVAGLLTICITGHVSTSSLIVDITKWDLVLDFSVFVTAALTANIASQSQAEGQTENTKSMTSLRVTQQAKYRGFFSINDFAPGIVIDNGSTSAVSTFQAAVNSGERVYVQGAATAYKMDGTVTVANACELRGDMYKSKLTHVGNLPMFKITSAGTLFDGFWLDGSGLTGQAYPFLFDVATGGVIRDPRIWNIRSFNMRGCVADLNGHDATHYLFDMDIQNYHAYQHKGPGFLIRDATQGFCQLTNTEVGLWNTNFLGLGGTGGDEVAYKFSGVAGLFLTRAEATGSMGAASGTNSTSQRLMDLSGLAIHIHNSFADNAAGEGAVINATFLNITDFEGSIANLEGLKLVSCTLVEGTNIRAQGRNSLGGASTANALHIDSGCSRVELGVVRAHNAMGDGVYSEGTNVTIGQINSHNNTGFGLHTVGATKNFMAGILNTDTNTAGQYKLEQATHHIGQYLSNAGARTSNIDGAVTV